MIPRYSRQSFQSKRTRYGDVVLVVDIVVGFVVVVVVVVREMLSKYDMVDVMVMLDRYLSTDSVPM